MKLLFKERLFSWLDSYDIFDEQGNVVYSVNGVLSWGHCLKISDVQGRHVGTVKEKVMSFLPKFEIFEGDTYLGEIRKDFSFFKPRFQIEFNGWQVTGNLMEWDYEIQDQMGNTVAFVQKEVWKFTDTYSIDIGNPEDSLYVVMLVLAIDAEKCSRNT